MILLLFLVCISASSIHGDVSELSATAKEHPKLIEFLQEQGLTLNDVEFVKPKNNDPTPAQLVYADQSVVKEPEPVAPVVQMEVNKVGQKLVYSEKSVAANQPTVADRYLSPKFQTQMNQVPKPATKRFFYLFEVPAIKKTQSITKTIINPGEKRINTIFIKAPNTSGGGNTIINQQGQVSEKTKVYVLIKEAENQEPTKLPDPIPVPPPEAPEVVFIKYKGKQELSELSSQNEESYNEEAVNVGSNSGSNEIVLKKASVVDLKDLVNLEGAATDNEDQIAEVEEGYDEDNDQFRSIIVQ